MMASLEISETPIGVPQVLEVKKNCKKSFRLSLCMHILAYLNFRTVQHFGLTSTHAKFYTHTQVFINPLDPRNLADCSLNRLTSISFSKILKTLS